ncbi:MAG: hypothetical protein JXA89_23775, partial [Anaerolineae bacterium]|nr:hypothetical protein [Anaerolineae bacterium]
MSEWSNRHRLVGRVILIAIVSILSLAACSRPESTPIDEPTTSVPATATSTPTPMPSSTPTTTQTSTATPSPTPTSTATSSPTPTSTATSSPTPTSTATPSPTPTLIQSLPPTSTPTPVYAAPTATPAPEARVQLVLVMPPGGDMLGASSTFDVVRRRGIRTLCFVSLDNHPDFVRLSIADGHLPGLVVRANEDPINQIAKWEMLLKRIMGGLFTPKLAVAEEAADIPTLERQGYTVIQPDLVVNGEAGQVVQATLDKDGVQRFANLAYAAASNGLGLGPHEIAERENTKPFA